VKYTYRWSGAPIEPEAEPRLSDLEIEFADMADLQEWLWREVSAVAYSAYESAMERAEEGTTITLRIPETHMRLKPVAE
jgi:hypothetical protein